VHIQPFPYPPQSNNGNKKGLSWDGEAKNVHPALIEASSWGYNWHTPTEDMGLSNVPMCWGTVDEQGQQRCEVQEIKNQLRTSNVQEKWVLGFNEPDFTTGGGSGLTPEEAWAEWGPRMLSIKDDSTKIVCPGISSRDEAVNKESGYASGLHWLDQFVKQAPSPAALKCDAQAIHWYDLAYQGTAEVRADAFKEYLKQAHTHVNQLFGTEGKPANMPLWVTEFGPEPGFEVDTKLLADFLTIVIPWMNEQPWIARHSAFLARLMVTPDGQLNEAGHAFINA